MRRGHSYFEVQRPRIEIIPMIDIMMFLLVFFIIITLKMIAGTGIQLELPGAATAQQLLPTKVTIGVQKDGTMFVKGKMITAPELKALLEQSRRPNKLDVVIAGDKAVPLQKLLDVMDVVRSAGIVGVGIATKPEGSSN